MKFFFGCDVGKYKIHTTILDEDSNIYLQHEIESRNKVDIDRQWELKNLFEDFIIDFLDINDITAQDIIVAVENPIYLNNIRTSFDIARTVFVGVETACSDVVITCFGVDNTVWKKAILFNGRANKEDIAKFAHVKWADIHFSAQDFMDAACIALHQYILMTGGNGKENANNKKTK